MTPFRGTGYVPFLEQRAEWVRKLRESAAPEQRGEAIRRGRMSAPPAERSAAAHRAWDTKRARGYNAATRSYSDPCKGPRIMDELLDTLMRVR